jgi:metallo-beta-lactamase family protein
LPLYTFDEAQDSLQYFRPVELEQARQLCPQISFRYVRAAHILGSCMVEVTVQLNGASKRLLFTGDVGRVRNQAGAPGKVVQSGPAEGETADILIMESTYGNRRHPTEDPRPQLAAIIKDTVERGGTVIVPAFAVERTQKLLFMLKELMEAGQIPRVPVFCDSPMAIKAVEIFLKYTDEYSDDTRDLIRRCGSPLEWPGFTFASTPEESKKINASQYPAIIISSSGMATGGRILHHLAQRMPDPKNTILFIGFQAPGTRGHAIKNGAKEIRMFGMEIPVRAKVTALEQFSDHADPPEMLEWLHTFPSKPKHTYLVHGEPDAASALRDTIEEQLGWSVEVAQWMQKVQL